LKAVLRGNRISDGSRHENTAEHSWHIALFALLLTRALRAGISIHFASSPMLLIPNPVEIDCGDTPLFDTDAASTQRAREMIAADRLYELLPARDSATLWSVADANHPGCVQRGAETGSSSRESANHRMTALISGIEGRNLRNIVVLGTIAHHGLMPTETGRSTKV
jgi:HD domain